MAGQELQKYQARYDQKFWEHNSSNLEILRHSTLHLTKMIGKLATYVETIDHKEGDASSEKIVNEVIPDLMQYSFRLANAFGVDASKQYEKRQKELEIRFGNKRHEQN